ncbi:DUF4832 domain-containing protein [Clostridium sp. D5]|uniref:DUF4832 domain-containing protein n=1 Tax=Clostridium sp. D5 TaxID=556261 RepID=UPI0001FC7BD1|nr:DUF4832 domain-containing protein [Clostridium sp. D5]EGB91733.1 hypothetical protein HMPREF0240_03385 [Clostridium sp. D5]
MISEYQARIVFTYEESSQMTANPFQGTYFQCSTGDLGRLYDVVEEHPDYRVVLLTFLLDDERELDVIPEEKMQDLRNALKAAEDLGLSVIFRAAYDFTGEYEDPDFEIMLKHIRQTGAVLNTYKSCIMGVQAGMIGAFGEWTQSRYMDTKRYRMEVIREWEDVLDERIPLSVRRQKFIREAAKWGCNTGRLGVYNDGLFSSESDLGTYREDYNREEDLEWSAENIKVPFNGGEMPFVSEFTAIENVVEEARQLNLSYLNQEYSSEVWEYWASQEYEDVPGDEYIKMHLGCRPWAETFSIDRHFAEKKKMRLKLKIRNSGFAMIDPDYHWYFILECGGKTRRIKAEVVMDSKEEGTVSAEFKNPFSKREQKEYGMSAGIQISKEEPGDIVDAYCLQLANDKTTYNNGVNTLANINQ